MGASMTGWDCEQILLPSMSTITGFSPANARFIALEPPLVIAPAGFWP